MITGFLTRSFVGGRPNGFKDELEKEIIEYTAKYNLELPTGRFVDEKGIMKTNRKEDSDSLKNFIVK